MALHSDDPSNLLGTIEVGENKVLFGQDFGYYKGIPLGEYQIFAVGSSFKPGCAWLWRSEPDGQIRKWGALDSKKSTAQDCLPSFRVDSVRYTEGRNNRGTAIRRCRLAAKDAELQAAKRDPIAPGALSRRASRRALPRHLPHEPARRLRLSDWANNDYIVVTIGYASMATFDDNLLTRLVFLAHHCALRVSLKSEKRRIRSISLTFSQRERTGDLYYRHPTLDDAVADFKKHVSLPEYRTEG